MALSFARLLCPSTLFGRCFKARGCWARLATRSHKRKRGRGTRPDIVGVVSCRGLEGPGGLVERGVWFIAHQCACFAVERRQLLALNAVLLVHTALTAQRVAGYLSTWVSASEVHGHFDT